MSLTAGCPSPRNALRRLALAFEVEAEHARTVPRSRVAGPILGSCMSRMSLARPAGEPPCRPANLGAVVWLLVILMVVIGVGRDVSRRRAARERCELAALRRELSDGDAETEQR